MAPVTKNYTLGRGKVHVARFKTGTQTPNGFRYLGNTPAFSMSISVDNLDHYDSDAGVNEKDDSVTLQTNRTATLTTDNINPENVALFFFGEASSVAQTLANSLSEEITGVKLDHGYRLGASDNNPTGYFGVNTVGFSVSDGNPSTAAEGDITFAGTAAANDTITIGGQVYKMVAAVADPFDVLIGADATESAANLAAAVNAGAGSGVAYGAGTIANSDVSATSALGVVTLTALTEGTGGNSIATTVSGADLTAEAATLTGGTGTVYVEGTDYTLEAGFGLVTFLSGGAVSEGDDVTVEFSVRASTRSRTVSGNSQVEGAMMYQANNPKGDNINYYFPYCRISPDGDFELKGDTWQELSLSIEILKPRSGGAAILADGVPAYS